MNRAVVLLLVLILAVSTMVNVLPAEAEARTIIVPDHYPTITQALNAAVDGDTIFVRKGSYDGPANQTLEINKTVTLIGEDVETTIINLYPPLVPKQLFTLQYMGYLDAINIEADNVKISNLTFNPKSTLLPRDGIYSRVNGNSFQMYGNVLNMILSASGDDAIIVGNRFALKVHIGGSNLTIINNTFKNEFHCIGSQNIFIKNTISNNYVEGANNILYNNHISDSMNLDGNENIIAGNNLSQGLMLRGHDNEVYKNNIKSGISVMCFNSKYYGNNIELDYPIVWCKDANNVFYLNNFYGDTKIRGADEELKKAYWDNGKVGNYWSNYKGMGITPYTVDLNNVDRFPLTSPFDIETINVDLPEWALTKLSTLSLISFLPEKSTEPFPIVLITVVSSVLIVVIATCLIVYRRKHNPPKKDISL